VVLDRRGEQRRGELLERHADAVPPFRDRGAPNPFHELEDAIARLVAHDVAEEASEQPDVVADGLVLLGRCHPQRLRVEPADLPRSVCFR
jgi:hypothetical protein